MGRTRARDRCAKGCVILNRRNGSGSLPVGTSPFAHYGDKRGATLLHKPITPSQMESLVCGLTAAPCPYACEHRQSCPDVTQAISYDPRFLHCTLRWSRLADSMRPLRSPFSTQIPDPAEPHTFLQPIDRQMPSPRPGDTNRVPRTSGLDRRCHRTTTGPLGAKSQDEV